MKTLGGNRMTGTIVLALLLLATILAYLPLLENQFINYDDPGYVTENPQVRSGLSPATVAWAFQATVQSNWHPLTWISHAIDCALFGIDPRFHHAMSLGIHLLSTALLLLFLRWATGSLWASAFVALVFALHPLHVESVAWAAERKDVLSGLWWMLTLLAYFQYCRSRSVMWYLWTLLAFILGLLAKPMLITLPFVLVLVDYWPIGRLRVPARTASRPGPGTSLTLMESVREKIPFFALSVLSSLVTYLVQRQGGSMMGLERLSLAERAANAVVSYGNYLLKTVFPVDLAIFYPHPASISPLLLIVSAIGILSVSLIVWRQRSERAYLLVGWGWFLGTLVPVIGIVQVGLQAMADRYMYLPIIGLAVMAAWGCRELVRQYPRQRFVLVGVAAVAGLLMGTLTFHQVRTWKDSATVFAHALDVTRENDVAHNNLALVLADSGRHAEALTHLRQAQRIRPDEPSIRINIARSLVALGERAEALKEYGWLLARSPADPALRARIGDVLADEGRIEEAIGQFAEALRLDSSRMAARAKLARLYLQSGQHENARRECAVMLAQEPRYAPALDLLGILAGREGRNDDALREFSLALEADSTYADAYNDLAILQERLGKADDALALYRKAARFGPGDWNIQFNLGRSLATTNLLDEAAMHWRRAVELNPRFIEARLNLGRLYLLQGKLRESEGELAEVLRLDANNVLAHYQYGNLLSLEGKLADAEGHLATAVRLAPTFQAAQQALAEVRALRTRAPR